MSFLKNLLGKNKPSTVPEVQHEQPQPQPKEPEQPLDQLVATRELIRLLERRKAEYVLEEEIPAQLILEEERLRQRAADLANRCNAQDLDLAEDTSTIKEHLTDLLTKARENLALVESELRKRGADAPVQLIKAEQRWRERIVSLEKSLGEQ